MKNMFEQEYSKKEVEAMLERTTVVKQKKVERVATDISRTENVVELLKKVGESKTNDELAKISRSLYNQNKSYKSIVNYYVNNANFPVYITAYFNNNTTTDEEFLEMLTGNNKKEERKEEIKLAVIRTARYLDKFNYKKHFKDIFTDLVISGLYVGYYLDIGDKHTLYRIPHELVMLSRREYDAYIYAFDYSYFDKNPEMLETYPQYFRDMYNDVYNTPKYKNEMARDSNVTSYIDVDNGKGIYIPINTDYADKGIEQTPLLFETITNFIKADIYEKSRSKLEEGNNNTILHLEVPTMKTTAQGNPTAYDTPIVHKIATDVGEQVEDIDVIVTPFSPTLLEKSSTDVDKLIASAHKKAYKDSNIPQSLYTDDKETKMSMETKLELIKSEIYGLYNIITTWYNNLLEKHFTENNIYTYGKVNMVRSITTTLKDDIERYSKDTNQFGYAYMGIINALRGLTPLENIMLALQENEAFVEIKDLMKPLKNTYTQGTSTVEETIEMKKDE